MSKINLTTNDLSLEDNDYRYQIDKPVIDVCGKKDNKTTLFYNSETIAKYLNISSTFFGKYISHNLSCPLSFNKEFKCVAFKGEYTNEIITKLLIEFINKYILCPICDLPETTLNKNKELGIYHNCKSCGNNTQIKINKIDKTYEFIEKNI